MGQDNGKNKKPSKAPAFNAPSALEVKTYIMAASKKLELYRSRKINQIKKRKQELAICLRQNNFEVAKAKMESTMRDEDVVTAYDIISPILEILKEKVTYIMSSVGCPPDLHPTLDTVIYASSRLEIEELHRLKDLIRYKYGESYIIGAQNNEFKTVNEQIIFRLSVKPIPDQLIMIRLKQIAKELNIICNFPQDMQLQSGMQGDYNNNPYGGNMGMPGPNMPNLSNIQNMSNMNNPYDSINMNKPYGGNQFNSGNPYENNIPNPYDSIGNAPNNAPNNGENNPYGNFNPGLSQEDNNNPYGNFNSSVPNMNNNPYSNGPSNPGISDFPSNPENPFNASTNMENNNNFDPYKSNFAGGMDGNDVNFNANNYNGPSEGSGDFPSAGNNNEGGFGGFDKNNMPDDKKDDLGFP